jgi:hypothetical protein
METSSAFSLATNIASSQDVPVIVRTENHNELKPMRWAWCRHGRKILQSVNA